MGLWLCKYYIRVERNNSVFEKVFGGQYYYRNFLVFANCQSFDFTANRNNIRRSEESYDIVVDAISEWMRKIKSDAYLDQFFRKKKEEENLRKIEKEKKEIEEKETKILSRREQRLNSYRARNSLPGSLISGSLLKEPRNEAETALLLQSMISDGHPGIDFRIGEYNTSMGVDLLVERNSKGIESLWWVELVHDLSCLNQWLHSPEGYHAVVCYDLGNIGEKFEIATGKQATLVAKEAKGRYVLTAGDDTYEVYVLRQMLE